MADTALVVGASRDIGAAVARRLAEDGLRVVLVGRDAEGLSAVCEELPDAEAVTADITTAHGAAAIAAAAGRHRPDIVVTVARARDPWARLPKLDPAALGAGVQDHLGYLVPLIAAALPAQRERRFGRWIFVSSTVARMGGPGQAVYAAHKLALEGLSRTLALEEGRNGITANVVSPGFVETQGTRGGYPPDLYAALSAMNTLGRIGRPEEIAHFVSALADRRAGFMTGSTLVVGGGVELAWPAALAVRDPALARHFATGIPPSPPAAVGDPGTTSTPVPPPAPTAAAPASAEPRSEPTPTPPDPEGPARP